MTPKQTNRLEVLISRMLDGALTENERLELQGMLRKHPEAVELYYSQIQFSMALDEVLSNEFFVNALSRKSKHRKSGNFIVKLAMAASFVLCLLVGVKVAMEKLQPKPPVVAKAAPEKVGAVFAGEGTVQIERDGKLLQVDPAKFPKIFKNDQLITGADTIVKVAIYNNVRVEVKENSRLSFKTSDGNNGANVFLEKGVISAQVGKRSATKPVFFFTETAKVKVVGTEFALSYHETLGTQLNMTEGKVEVSKADSEFVVPVEAGQTIVVTEKEEIKFTDINEAMIAYWPLDVMKEGRVREEVTNKWSGVVYSNAPISNRKFSFKKHGFPFKDSTRYIDCGKTESFNLDESVTVSAWVKVNKFVGWAGIAERAWDTGSTEFGYGLFLGPEDDDNVCFALFTEDEKGGGDRVALKVNKERWYHVVGTYDGRSQKLYINGLEVDDEERDGKIVHKEGQSFFIGRHLDDNEDKRFDGHIREVRLYKRALSAQEVNQLYLQN